jgi:FxsC-like protein
MPWVQAVIPWNVTDDENRKVEGKLRAALDAAFGRKLAEVASTSALAAHGVPSLADFDAVMRQLIGAASKKYLLYAAAFPPDGELVERPRIS